MDIEDNVFHEDDRDELSIHTLNDNLERLNANIKLQTDLLKQVNQNMQNFNNNIMLLIKVMCSEKNNNTN